LALAEAHRWFLTSPDWHRILVLFTDGEPDDGPAATAAIQQLRRDQVKLMVGSIGVGLDRCACLFPGAVVFDVTPETAASSLHVAIRRIQSQTG
jgi:hypothetical protein